MKKITAIVSLIVSMLIFSATTVYAAGGLLLTGDGFEKQEKSNWCWVACARNSVHHETSSHRTQKEAVRHIKGTLLNWYPNETGTILEIEEAAEYISKDTEAYTGVYQTLEYRILKSEVEYSNATIACVGYYNSNNVRTGGHAVTIAGYYLSDTDEYINYHDPLTGEFNTCEFSRFCNGEIYGGIYDQTCINNEA